MFKETYEPLYNSVDELLNQLDTAVGRKFYELDINHRLDRNSNKGVLGQIVEEGVFHYPINSRPEADFANLGIELKTLGVLRNKRDISAKERLPLNTFNYDKVAEQEFEDSDVWHKCEKMLLALYEYIEGIPYGDMRLIKGLLHEFEPSDLAIIQNDYRILQEKIRNGFAADISESDTNYLAACTAGGGHGQTTSTIYSNVPVKPRKFSLKTNYMTTFVRKHLTKVELEHIVAAAELMDHSLEEVIISRLNRYVGISEYELTGLMDREFDSKDRFERYVAFMLGAKGKVNNSDEFQKANITLKTIRVEEDGSIEQNMSFPAFSFIDIVNEEWEESSFRDMMINQKFLFVIFRNVGGQYVFDKAKFWSIPEYILDTEGRAVFEELKDVLISGNIVRGFQTLSSGKTIRLNNFPKSSTNGYFHIRPHGQDSTDTNPLPVPDRLTGAVEFTKQCFWLHRDYVLDVINED